MYDMYEDAQMTIAKQEVYYNGLLQEEAQKAYYIMYHKPIPQKLLDSIYIRVTPKLDYVLEGFGHNTQDFKNVVHKFFIRRLKKECV